MQTSIYDPGLCTDCTGDVVREPLAEIAVNILGLLGSGYSACTNGPDWLVRYHHLIPVLHVVWVCVCVSVSMCVCLCVKGRNERDSKPKYRELNLCSCVVMHVRMSILKIPLTYTVRHVLGLIGTKTCDLRETGTRPLPLRRLGQFAHLQLQRVNKTV